MKFFSELETDLHDTIIFLDIDGTLTWEGNDTVDAKTLQKIQELKKRNEVVLCSNGKSIQRNRKLAKLCQVKYLETPLRKPCKEICLLVENKDNKPFVVIGNLFYTDGRFARNIGGRFIKVRTLLGKEESWVDRLLYFFDEKILSHFV